MVSEFYPRLGFEEVKKDSDGSVEYVCTVGNYTPHPVFVDVSLLR